jgi:Flp pilus assembly protein TadG
MEEQLRPMRRIPRSSASNLSGQALVEFALVLPVIFLIFIGAIDFGRVMQARVTAESAAKAGAQWGAAHIQNATQGLEPAYALATSPKNCGTAAGLDYPPTCNVLFRACAEARGLPGFSGGTIYQSDDPAVTSQACTTGSAANICSASASQANPFLTITWKRAGVAFTPTTSAAPRIGDTLTVDGAYCFKTFFPQFLPISRITWSSPATYTVQP